jgi:tubulin polyglutamylase TTLL6/13
LTRNLDDFDPYEHYVVQRYLHKPFLIDKLKFDLRIYVLLCGVDPLRIFYYKEGLCRLATAEYRTPTQNNLDNLYMHLTNYAINKSASNYIANKGSEKDDLGHKRSLTFAYKYIEDQGFDITKLEHDIKATIIKTICAVQPTLSHTYRSCQPDDVENSMCFEILGFDIFLDDKLKPWILEVNHAPSFSTDSPLDFKVKKNLIVDTIKMLNLTYWKKLKFKK